jgi:aryl-alcohol dehydrogenase-like predicted oxidoreductase
MGLNPDSRIGRLPTMHTIDDQPHRPATAAAGIASSPIGTALLGPLVASRIGLGCMVLTRSYADVDDGEARATIDRALDAGVTLLDTADAYAAGDNERFVGRAIRERRDDVVLCSKFGLRVGPDGCVRVDGRPEYVAAACDGSLARLGVDVLDLYYQHRVDPTVPIEETVGAMASLVEAGKVRHLGLSEPTAGELRRAHLVHPITAVQSEWSLFGRSIESAVVPTCRELGVGIVAYAPLGRGFLTGALDPASWSSDDLRAPDPRFQGANLAHNRALLGVLHDVARRAGATPSQVALAWLLARGTDVVPIPGMERRQWLDENLGALDLRLDDSQLSTLDHAFAPGVAAGDPDDVLLRRRALAPDRPEPDRPEPDR